MAGNDAVALVGGGGKSTAMFRLAREAVERGGLAITTTTTKIYASQIAHAPASVPAAEASRARVAAALAVHRHVLVIGPENRETKRSDGVPLGLFHDLRAWFPDAALINEADGSRMRPFKAPAAHEPVIPAETTLVVLVVGADALGQPLDDDHVHRAERVSALSGTPVGAPITVETVARTLGHADGGRKGVPEGARIVALVNKVDALRDPAPAHALAAALLREPTIEAVVLGAARAEKPVLEVVRR